MLQGTPTDAQVLKELKREIKNGTWSNPCGIEHPISMDDLPIVRQYVAEDHSQMQRWYPTDEIKKLIEKERERHTAKNRPT